METQQNEDLEFSRVLFLLKRRAWVILSVGLIAAVAAFAYSSAQPELYRASAEINAVDQTSGLFSNSGDPNPQRDVNNALFLIESRAVQDPAKETLGTSASMVRSISATADKDTDILTVTVAAESPEVARDAANALADVFVSQQERLNVLTRQNQAEELRKSADEINTQIATIDASLADAPPDQLDALRVQKTRLINQQADLLKRANEFDTEATLKSGVIRVLVPAEAPSKPFEPQPWRDAAIAGMVGLFLGTAAVITFEWINNRVGSPEEASQLSGGLPIVGMIPLSGRRRLRHRRLPPSPRAFVEAGSPAQEAYRSLATNVRFSTIGRSSTRIAVTSPSEGEGKTTVVANLARALAEGGSKVAVISADLRRPTLGEFFDIDETKAGLTTVLLGDTSLGDAATSVKFDPGITLIFLAAGPIPGNPQAILGSPAMGDVIKRLENAGADTIILDTAPILPVSDTLALVQHCDSVLLSIVPNGTKRSYLTEAVNRLRRVGTEILGISLDGVTEDALGYYGAGAGSYGSRPEDNKPAVGPVERTEAPGGLTST